MSDTQTLGQKAFGAVAPALADYTDRVLFSDVWERPGLSPRDRSLITITTLIALYRVNELQFHLKKAIENDVTRDEIHALGVLRRWPAARTAVGIARRVFEGASAS